MICPSPPSSFTYWHTDLRHLLFAARLPASKRLLTFLEDRHQTILHSIEPVNLFPLCLLPDPFACKQNGQTNTRHVICRYEDLLLAATCSQHHRTLTALYGTRHHGADYIWHDEHLFRRIPTPENLKEVTGRSASGKTPLCASPASPFRGQKNTQRPNIMNQ